MRVFKMILAILAAVVGFFIMSQASDVDAFNSVASALGNWVGYDDTARTAFKGISTGIKALGLCMIGGGIVMFIGGLNPKKELDIASFVVFLVSMFIGLVTFYPYKRMIEYADEDVVSHAILVTAMGTGLCLVLAASNIYDFLKLKKAAQEEQYRQYIKAKEEERRKSASMSDTANEEEHRRPASKPNWGDDIEY